MNYTGQTTPYVVGFWIADSADSLYVYAPNDASKIQKGNLVTITGTKGYYVPANDQGAATELGYAGMLQLTSPTIVENDGKEDNVIPEGAINITTIEDINKIPLTQDLSGKIYRVKGRYLSTPNDTFTNFTITDLNRVDYLLAYTQSNGKDFEWTNGYSGQCLEMTLVLSLGKPSVKAWRFCPVEKNGDVTVTNLEEAQFGAKRAFSDFVSSYSVKTTLEIDDVDPVLAGLTRNYSSESGEVTVSDQNGKSTVTIDVVTTGKISIKVLCSYNGATAEGSYDVDIIGPVHYDTVSIATAKSQPDDAEVSVEAIVCRVTYKGSMTKQGLFLADTTGSLFAYNGDDTMANVVEGNKVVITGKMAHYIKNAPNATAESYAGDVQLTNFTVKNVDANNYDIPTEAIIIGKTITDIVSTRPANNLSSLLYKVKAKVYKASGTYPSYSLQDPDDTATALPLYSQNSGADYAWLDDYLDDTVTILVGIQNLNLKATNSNWRGVPAKILTEVA